MTHPALAASWAAQADPAPRRTVFKQPLLYPLLSTWRMSYRTRWITVNTKEKTTWAVLYIRTKTRYFCRTGSAEGPGTSAPASQRDARHWGGLVPDPSVCTGRRIPLFSQTDENSTCTFRNFKNIHPQPQGSRTPLTPDSAAQPLPYTSMTVKSLYHFSKLHRLTLLFLGRTSVFAVCP